MPKLLLPRYVNTKPPYLLLSLLLFVLVAGFSFAQSYGNPSASPVPVAAPLNPEFVQYWNKVKQGVTYKAVTSGGRALGEIPSPIDFSHLAQQAPSFKGAAPLPSSFDLRQQNKMSSVRDQGNCGACWTFATLGALESALLPGESRTFSENNLKNLHGFDTGPCDGGSTAMGAAYLVRWGTTWQSGPVNDSDDPYQATTNPNTSPLGLPVQKHVQNINVYPGRKTTTAPGWDNTILKNAVMTDGAMYTSMYWDDPNEKTVYNPDTAAYYYSGNAPSSNHAVVIAGWDDNFPASSFKTPPPGNGAFLIKNSWGTKFGTAGYFWISYYDTVYAMTKQPYAFVGNEAVTNYARKYEYDPLGPVDTMGYGSSTAWFANVFTAVATEPLSAVSFWATANNSTYSIYVYTNVQGDPASGTLVGTAITTGSMPVAGYHTVTLASPVTITKSQSFAVVVKLTTPGYNSPISLHYAYPNYSSKVTASAGQSYVSADNGSLPSSPSSSCSSYCWTDTTTLSAYPNANVSLKAFTSATAAGAYPLIVNSTNPPSGVAISVGVPDNSGASNGSTSLTRIYSPGTSVTLTAPTTLTAQNAPATAVGAAFSTWSGCDSSPGSSTCTLAMNAGRTVTANYLMLTRSPGSSAETPEISSLNPPAVKAGSQAFTLVVNGSGFAPGAGVQWNGSDRTSTTTVLSDSQLLVPIAAADIATFGTVNVTVSNVASGGGVSAAFTFAVDSAASVPGALTLSSTSTSLILNPGDAIDVPVTLAGANAGAQISVTCANLPGAVCTYSNGVATIATADTTPTGAYSVLLIFSVTQQVSALNHRPGFWVAWTGLMAVPVGLLWIGSGRRRRFYVYWLALMVVILILPLVGCGGSASPPVTSNATTATTVTTQSTLPVSLMVVDLN
jgi:C1A family cysteine protease